MNEIFGGLVNQNEIPTQIQNNQQMLNIQEVNAAQQQLLKYHTDQEVQDIRYWIQAQQLQNSKHSVIIRNCHSDSYYTAYVDPEPKIPINWGYYFKIVILFLPILSLLTLWLL